MSTPQLIHNNGFLKVQWTKTDYINAAITNGYIPNDGDLIFNYENNTLYFGDGTNTINNLQSKSIFPENVDNSEKTLKDQISTILIKCGTDEKIKEVEDEPAYLKNGEPLYNLTLNTLQIGDGITPIKNLPYIGTSMIDAPADNNVYVRSNNTWKKIKLTVQETE